MPNTSPRFAALTYLNYWLGSGRRIHNWLNSTDRDEQLVAMSDTAKRFRIARNFHAKHDTGKGLSRYEPILDVIDDLTSDDFADDLASSVLAVRDRLSGLYGGTNVLSGTTKFLWAKLRFPIVIYDRQARIAIGTRSGDLSAYYDAWFDRFSASQDAIRDACRSLIDMRDYTCDPITATPDYLSELADADWFHHRVFDILLWHEGIPDGG